MDSSFSMKRFRKRLTMKKMEFESEPEVFFIEG